MSLARPSPIIAPGQGLVAASRTPPGILPARPILDDFILSPADAELLARTNPPLFLQYQARARLYNKLDEKTLCEGSLIEFIRRAWREIESRPLVLNWHHEVIAAHLESITYGNLRSLIVNIPPRTGKTLFINVFWPAWVWCRSEILPLSGAQVSFLSVSYGATLSEEIAVKMRRLVEGDWYQSLWGETTKLLDDQRNRANFANVSGGERISSSIEGGILGRGALCLSGAAIVHTKTGPKRIYHLGASSAPEYILSYDFAAKAPAYHRVLAIARRRASRLYRIHTQSGRVVEATGEHPFFTRRGWIQALALSAGDVLLSCVRESDIAPGRRDGEVGSPQESLAVLQPQLYDRGEERSGGQTEAAMPGMQGAAAFQNPASRRPLLQRHLQGRGPGKAAISLREQNPGSAMRNMRPILPADDEYDSGALLLAPLRVGVAFDGDEGAEEPGIPPWQSRDLREERAEQALAGGQAASVGTRRLSLRDLPEDGRPGGASHQYAADGSPIGKPRLPLSGMPQEISRSGAFEAEEDTVSRVEPVDLAADEEVFDLQIEGTRCFFANDILVHNCQIIDDPQTRRGADSLVERAASLQGMSDLSTRITDPRVSAKVLVMQRLHINDATDWALKNWPKDTKHLMFPARFESDRACEEDIREYDGQLLWPEVWTDAELSKIEAGLAALDGDVLSDYAIAGQLQQNPRPRAGGIVNKDDWQLWPEWTPGPDDIRQLSNGRMYVPLPEVSRVIVCVDTALSEKETADWNACVVLGVWHRSRDLVQIVGHENRIDDGEQPRVVVMWAWHRRCKLNDDTLDVRDGKPQGLVQRIIDTGRRFNADEVIIENKTRGLDVKNEIERQLSDLPFRLRLFNPGKHGDKTARLNSVQPLFSQGLIYMPGDCRLARDRAGVQHVVVDEFVWAQELISEVEAVPRGAHDDLSDALVEGLICLREDGYLALTQEYVASQMAARMFKGKRTVIRDSYGV